MDSHVSNKYLIVSNLKPQAAHVATRFISFSLSLQTYNHFINIWDKINHLGKEGSFHLITKNGICCHHFPPTVQWAQASNPYTVSGQEFGEFP